MVKGCFRFMLVLLLLLFVLSACGGSPKSYTVERAGRSFTVDTEKSTITCGIDTYNYELSKYGLPYKLTIYYPNGRLYWWNQDKNFGFGGWTDDYTMGGYVGGDVLAEVLEAGFPRDYSDRIMPGFLLLVLGCVHIFAPVGIWACCFALYRNGEPADGELIAIRLIGVLIIMGTAAWFWGYF